MLLSSLDHLRSWERATHMGRSGQELHRMFSSVALSASKAEPVRVNGPVSIAGSNSHSVAAPSGCTIIPLALRQRLGRTRPFLVAAFEAMSRSGESRRDFTLRALRTVRETVASHGSHQTNLPVIPSCQCTKSFVRLWARRCRNFPAWVERA